MHYCFFTTGTWVGNASLIRPQQLGAQFLARGHSVSYIIDDLPENHGDVGIHPKADLAFVKNFRSIGQHKTRRKIIAALNPDYVDLLNPHPKSYLAMLGMKNKIIGEWDEPPTMKNLGVVKNLMFGHIDRWMRRRAVVRVAVTRFVAEWFLEKYNLSTYYIPHAPYLKHFPDGDSPFDLPTAVYMGNLYPEFDHDVILHAAKILKARGKLPRIVLMGDGPQMAMWKQFVSENNLGSVTLAGYTTGEELWRKLRHAHVLLFPIRPTVLNKSRLPSKMFAYAQARRPIITSAVGELPLILGDKPTFIESTAEAFAEKLDAVMSAPRPPDVEYNLDRHSWSERADRLLEAIAEYESRGR